MGDIRKRMDAINGRIDSTLDLLGNTSNKKVLFILFIITFAAAVPILIG